MAQGAALGWMFDTHRATTSSLSDWVVLVSQRTIFIVVGRLLAVASLLDSLEVGKQLGLFL